MLISPLRIIKASFANPRPPVQTPAAVVTVAVAGPEERRPHGITCLAVSPAGTRVAARSLDGRVYEYDLYAPEATPLRVYASPAASFYAKLAYSPSGRHLAAGSSSLHLNIFDTMADVFDATKPVEPVRRLQGHSQAVFAVDWSPTDDQIATCSDDGSTRLWTVQPNRPQLKRRRTEPLADNLPMAAADDVALPLPPTLRGPVQRPLEAFWGGGGNS